MNVRTHGPTSRPTESANHSKPVSKGARAAGIVLPLVAMTMFGFTTTAAGTQAPQPRGVCHAVATGTAIKWGPKYDSCSYTSAPSGWSGYLNVTWSTNNGQACVQGRMAKPKKPQKWQSLSCGLHGQGKVKWPKNTASKLEIRVKSQQAPTESVAYSI